MIEVRAFKTQDGQYFSSKEKAEAHELRILFSQIANLGEDASGGRLPFCCGDRSSVWLCPVKMMETTLSYVDDLRILNKAVTIKRKFGDTANRSELGALIYAAENSTNFGKILAYIDGDNPHDVVVKRIR